MNKITATYSTARTYRRMILAQYSNIDTTSPLLDSVAIGMAVPAGTNTFYSDSLWASDTCIAIMAAQEASCENFQITAGDYFTLRDSTAVGYDAYIQDSTIETAGDMLAIKAYQKQLDMFNTIDPHTPTSLTGDPHRLKQVIINLAGNAIKFTQDGEITIHVETMFETDDQATLKFTIAQKG